MSRPEHQAPPEIYYNENEAKKYTSNSRILEIQSDMARRALELLNLPPNTSCYLLDIGCGSGLSGEILEAEEHVWVGLDIAPAMLQVALEREVEGDLFLQDVGQGLGFRPGVFDGAISISALQWLCNADKQSHNPRARLHRFFSTLYSCLRRGARAVFQFYPENDDQCELIMNTAMRCGFEGGMVIDYPNSKKAKKYFLCLFAGQALDGERQQLPKGLGESETEESTTVAYSRERIQGHANNRNKQRRAVKDKDWVLHKKELARKRGKPDVPRDSQFTGRNRKPRF
ncbi:11296_t:CDS:2 [Paraglomus brasilianum]|uniref:11296_t:CDS:1 n=1 Tax=Paraglomus brasilianum TaxID=144538 RepID=A0A9N8YTQ6_9GLOM|nr:11296_t:CDS:2 [Paraglomus brasilianum]